jgi:hypothetical protein
VGDSDSDSAEERDDLVMNVKDNQTLEDPGGSLSGKTPSSTLRRGFGPGLRAKKDAS